MKIEVGKKYIDNNGDISEIISKIDGVAGTDFCAIHRKTSRNLKNDNHFVIYTEAGKYVWNVDRSQSATDKKSRTDMDLVEEYREPATCQWWASVEKNSNTIANVYKTDPSNYIDKSSRKVVKVRIEEIR